ncbi:30S ribosomal protein S13 [Patescibacteria group bacterium]|nr:30S ribosomal protein S13 [Patescibacteria group bacterium]
MARIVGVNLPSNKRTEIGLTYIFGIGRNTSNKILKQTKINPDKRVKDLTTSEIEQLRKVIENKCRTEGTLKRDISGNIKRLKEIGCYRGLRHTVHLPVRGQRTKTNSRTVRGNVRQTMGSGRQSAAKKT